MTITTLEPNAHGFAQLRLAAMKSRSVAAEGGYLDIMTDTKIPELNLTIRGLDNLLCDPRTIDLLLDLEAGTKTCDAGLWMNLAQMVKMSANWQVSLAVRGYEMPEPMDALRNFAVDA